MNQKEIGKIKITLNGKQIEATERQTILEVAKEHNIDIPSLCYHSDLTLKSGCRVCVVEIKGQKCLQPACSTKVCEGMEIITDSPQVEKARKTNLELLFSQHKEECADCIWSFNCRLLDLAKKYKVKITRFQDRKRNFPVYKFGPALIFDSSKCIDCGNCVEMCQEQEVGYLEIRPSNTLESAGQERYRFCQILPSKHRECIYCGQCISHCPVGAFEAVGEFEEVEKPLQQKDKVVVFQFAPSIRTSIGEEFGMKPGEVVTEKLVAGIKKLGADKVFDVSVGADFTTTEEAGELLEKLKTGEHFTMFSSCCPAWVRFAELYYPQFVPHLATARPPHIILGGLIKTYWAIKEKIDPRKIVVVSVMPCVAKKYEIRRKELKIKGLKPVDYVLTTRELAYLFIKHKIDLKKVKPQKADNPLGVPSGGGVIYGASGGVMESALRSALARLNGKKLPKLEFKEVRGQEGIKKTELEVNGRKLKLAAVSGTGNAKKILEELKKNPATYDCVEVMACPGGCIGGGGQPVPADSQTRKKRAKGLYEIDDKTLVRISHENPIVKRVYKDFLVNDKIIKAICHATYVKNKK